MKLTTLNKIFAGILAAGSLSQVARAQSADALIDKLVSKGVLTVDEANDLREETDKGFESAYQVKSGLPDWVTTLRIGGDFRGRYEAFYSDDPRWSDRTRFRYRIRPGIVATIKDNFEVGFRLTSSEPTGTFGGDPISGNTTFQDNASKKFVYIDLAYAKWTAINNATWSGTLALGKMENPYVFSDMIFDADYTPEGFGQQVAFHLSPDHSLKLNAGEFVLDEINQSGNGLRASEDSYMLGAQVRLDSTWSKHIASTIGFGFLMITADQSLTEGAPAGPTVPNVNGIVNVAGNTRVNGLLVNNYNPWTADAAVTYTMDSFPMYNAAFPIRLAGEYLQNPAADDQNEAYSVGVTFGKAGKKGLWEVSYRWKHLEADAWWEEVVDSDFGTISPANGRYFAGTNVEGHIFKASYSPYDSLTFGITYFLTEQISGVPKGYDENMGRLQIDAVWKF
jgi:hypothetical protein